jgi:putative peptidoglycan lipid II flippase
MIFGVIVLTPIVGIYGAAYGVVVGSVLHLLTQLPLLKKINYKHYFTLGFREAGVREVFKLLPPRLFASSINQISAVVDTTLAIAVSVSSVVVFKFAEQLQTFPVNLFGVSIALAALPTLSFVSDDKDFKKFKETLMTSLLQMFFLVLPASIVLLVLKVPLVRLVYGASGFSWPATVATSYTLAFFALSIFTQSAVYLITRAFYALHDTKTPLKVVFFSIATDIILSVVFVKFLGLGVWSIALSYSLSSFIDFTVLLALLSKKIGGLNLSTYLEPFLKISYSAVFMGISLYVPMKILENLIFDTTRTVPLALLTLTATLFSFASYLVFTKVFAVKKMELLYSLLAKFKLRPSIAAATEAQTAGKEDAIERSLEV